MTYRWGQGPNALEKDLEDQARAAGYSGILYTPPVVVPSISARRDKAGKCAVVGCGAEFEKKSPNHRYCDAHSVRRKYTGMA